MKTNEIINACTSRVRGRARTWYGHGAVEAAAYHARAVTKAINLDPTRTVTRVSWSVEPYQDDNTDGVYVVIHESEGYDTLRGEFVGVLT